MALINSASKSSRLLASRRYTHDTFTDAQESFTNVLDLRAEEIYTQAQYIPSSALPFSGSSQHGLIQLASGSNLMKYWYRHKLTPSNVNTETWFFLNPTGSDDGIGAQLINDNQEVNFISPKYSVSSLANAITEDATPGYGVVLYKSSTYTQTSQTGSLDGGDKISGNDYIFDYKTGVVQFMNSSVDPASNEVVFMTAYQYVGKTLATGLDIAGDITASNMLLTGNLQLGGGSGDTISVTAEYSGSLIPDVDDAFDLGKSDQQWKDLYINGVGYIDSFDAVTSTGIVSGSAVYGTTLGQNTTSGLKTITIESNSTVNQDLTTDANVQFAVITGSAVSTSGDVHGGSITSTGNISGSSTSTGSFGRVSATDIDLSSIKGNWTNVGNTVADLGSITTIDINGGTIDGVSNVNSTGTITGSAVYGTTIGQNRTDGLKTITIEANSIINQDVSTDADATLGTLGVGNVTSTGIVSGSSVYGTTIGQTRVDGLKTITIEANSIINQDVSTDANATLGTLGVGNVTSTGTVSGSAVYGTTIGQNTTSGLKTITIESNSTVNQDLTTDADVTFGSLISGSADLFVGAVGGNQVSASGGNLKVSGKVSASSAGFTDVSASTAEFTTATITGGSVTGITDIIVADGGTGVSTLTDGGILLGSGTDPITAMAVLGDSEMIVGDGSTDPVAESGATLRTSIGVGTGDSPQFTGVTATGTITGSAVYGTTIGQNRIDGVKTITIESNSTVNQDLTTDASPTFDGLTLTGNTLIGTLAANRNLIVHGDLTAQNYIVSSSVTHLTQSFSSGSTIFGDSPDDTHRITGSLFIGTGSLQSVEHITGSGVISGSEVYGTTIGQNRTDGLKTITIEANSIINQDLSTDADATLGTLGVGNVTSTGIVKAAGVLSGSSDAFFGQYGVSYVSASAGSIQATNYVSGSEVKAPIGTFGTATISAGTITGITDLVVADGGTGASTLTDGGILLGSGTDPITAMSVLSDGEMIVGDGSTDPVAESGTTLRTSIGVGTGDTPQFTGLTATGTITGSAVYGTTIGQNRTDGVKTITIEANSIINQDLSTDANATLGTLGVGNVTSTGTVSGSAVYGTTLGQNRVDGLKTITIESNSTINQDVTTDATPTFGGATLTGDIKTSGVISGSSDIIVGNIGGSHISGSTGNLKVTDSLLASKVSGSEFTGSSAIFDAATITTATIVGGTVTGITDITVADGGTGASTFTDGGILLGSGTGAITATSVLADGEILIGDGTTDPVALDVGGNGGITILGTIATGTWEATDVAVAHGGTGVSTLTDGGVLLGSGTSAVTAMAVLGDGEFIVGDGSTDPVAESGTTLRTSIGVGTGDSPTFTGLTLTGDLTVQGDTTTLSTTNLQVGDAFIFTATGSAASNVDGGLIVQSGSAVDSGSAIYHDTQDERWAVAKGVASDGTAVTPTAYVSTITTANHSPNTDSGSYGSGEMWVNTTDEEIWVRTG